MYFNPSYMNAIAQQPMQQQFSQQPTQEPLEGIASLGPTQPPTFYYATIYTPTNDSATWWNTTYTRFYKQ
jgi:hypothetical protein